VITRLVLVSSWFALLVAACAGADKSVDSPADAPGESLVRVMESLAESVQARGRSCDEFAELLGRWVERERSSIANLVAELEQRVVDMTDEEIEQLDERLTAAFEVIVLRAAECETHAEAQRAFAAFDAVIEGS
jgi:hypothetical protein